MFTFTKTATKIYYRLVDRLILVRT